MTLDFREIPQANIGGGLQDTWELFCRDFFINQQYEIIEEPTRGADGGLDIKIKNAKSKITYLVSCKHKAHSGLGVSPSEEINILERVYSHKCDGFIGFYSTIATNGLHDLLKGLSDRIPYELYDREKIERMIVGFYTQENLFIRFFPESYRKFRDTYFYREPVELFLSYVDKEYNIFKFEYEALFKSIENIIWYLRRDMTFTEALKHQDVNIITIDGIEKIHNWKYEFKYSGISRDYSLVQMWNELIPREVEYLHGIKIYGKHSLFSIGALGLWILYPNYLVCSPEFVQYNEEAFKELAKVIR